MKGLSRQVVCRVVIRGVVCLGLMGGMLGQAWSASTVWPVQMPYEAPPRSEPVPDVSVAPNTQPLTPEELQRAEALLPLLEGKQEFWAMGEFVHLGEPVLSVVTKALSLPGPRIRYNAIETLSLIKSPAAVPALLDTARLDSEIPRIREHALRVAVRLDPMQTAPAIEAMTKDANSSIRKAAAVEARYVRRKEVIQPLIDLLGDDERFVALSAVQSLWTLTRHETEFHDWDASSKQDRQAWAQEWNEWWNQSKETFEMPEPKSRKRAG
ncbi:MAG: HEAT repeat domain-containing protein [Nitrospira sp.]|nr:HEAT repeat domain-containing protein [Nitrospira sp.]